ncbi:MAG TPA: hypothetical protein PLN52_12620 [Opitutaceae bacterium]|nr:hypothetical protein [Opitutaceae bacterium]
MQTKPQLLTWITCDGIHIDPSTGKQTLLGVFTGTRAREFPFVYPFMIWFITVGNVAAGDHKVKIQMGLQPTELQPLIEREFKSEGTHQRINLINEMANLPFPTPGEYLITIEVDGELLLTTSMHVVR